MGMAMRFDYRAAGPIATAAVVLLLSACSRTQQDWRVAQRAGTPRAYQVFVARHPHSELAGVARQRIAQLTEAAAWREATHADSVAAYQSYLARYPNGTWSQDARIRMESRNMEGRPTTGGGPPPAMGRAVPHAASTTAAVTAPAGATVRRALPAPAPAASAGAPAAALPQPPVSAPSAVGFAVQLGAFSSAANADTAWRRLSSRLGPRLLGPVSRVVPVSISGRRLYRLEIPVADRAAGRRLCQRLHQHSQACLPVP